MPGGGNPPALRAVLLSGARRIGKTSLLQQTTRKLIESGVEPNRILCATFDYLLLKLPGSVEFRRAIEPIDGGLECRFFDEILYAKDWQVWTQHPVDFNKQGRLVVTGSVAPWDTAGQESGAAPGHTLHLANLSFYELLRIRKAQPSRLPGVMWLHFRTWPENRLITTGCGFQTLGRPLQR